MGIQATWSIWGKPSGATINLLGIDYQFRGSYRYIQLDLFPVSISLYFGKEWGKD